MRSILSRLWNDSADLRLALKGDSSMAVRRRNWVQSVNEASERLRVLTDGALHEEATQRRQDHLRSLGTQSILNDTVNLTGMAALMSEAIRRTLGLHLFDQQIEAGLILTGRNVCEMQTGEGKTLAMGLAAALQAINPLGVHIACANDYLATRDCELLAPAFELLGLNTASITSDLDLTERQIAYQADITYAAGHTYGFDFLRDQEHAPARFPSDSGWAHTNRRQRGLRVAMIDELDHVLIDDAISPLVLSADQEGVAEDLTVIVAADCVATELMDRKLLDQREQTFALSKAGWNHIHASKPPGCQEVLRRPWHEYVGTALKAHQQFHLGVDYVIRDGDVCVVDRTSGRVHSDRSWPDGLQQAMEAKEKLPIRPTVDAIAEITRQRFFQAYASLSGCTATAADCASELKAIYDLRYEVIAPRVANQRHEWPMIWCLSRHSAMDVISQESQTLTQSGRSVLVATRDIATNQSVGDAFRDAGLEFAVLDGVQNATEASLVAAAGQPGVITIATQVAGRGTDIRLATTTREAGGLHVIVFGIEPNRRVEQQVIGRCARRGDPGSTRLVFHAEDPVLLARAPWIVRSIERHCSADHPAIEIDPTMASTVRRHIRRAQDAWRVDQARIRSRIQVADARGRPDLDVPPRSHRQIA